MSDYPKHSRTTVPRPSTVTCAAAICVEVSPLLVLLAHEQANAPADKEPEPAEAGESATYRYSIRVADRPGTPCAICSRPTGCGPVGYREDDPICDLCLLEACSPLGLTLSLVAVTRAFAIGCPRTTESTWMALAELGAFARIFEHVASTWGPARFLGLPGNGKRQ